MQQELIEMLEEMVKYFYEISSDSYYYRETGAILNEAEKLVEKAKNSVKEPAVPQGEPVACLVRWRGLRTPARNAHDGQDHFSEWSDWRPETLKYGMAVTDPSRNSGPEHLFEMLPLVLATPAAPSQGPVTDEEKQDLVYEKLSACLHCGAQSQEPALHIGACITNGVLHATVMRREANGHVTILATAEMDAKSLLEHDCVAKLSPAAPSQPVLTDERLREIDDAHNWQTTEGRMAAYRAIIAALREKEAKATP